MQPAANRSTVLLPGAVVALLAAVTSGCGDGASDRAGVRFDVTDSAGVEIVRNGRTGALGDSLLPLVEQVRIGVVEGAEEYELFAVRDVAVGPDGEIIAALQTAGEVRVFGADGIWQRTIGRQGEGPGEFGAVTWVAAYGDTLMAYDPRLDRMTLFTMDGELLDTWMLRSGMATIFPYAPAPGGWFVTLDDYSARVSYGVGTPGTDTSRIAVLPSIPDALAALPSETPLWQVIDVVVQHPSWTTWGVGTEPFVFGRNALWDSREHHAFDAGGRIYVSRGSRYAIDVYDATGTLVRRVTREHDPVPITDVLVNRYRSEVVAHYDTMPTTGEAGLDLVAAAEQQIALPGPDHVPVLGDLLVSAEGAIWVERPDLVDDPLLLEWTRAGTQPERWDVFDPEGRFLGTVELPLRSTLHVVGTDWIVVTERDALDVQYVVRYGIGM